MTYRIGVDIGGTFTDLALVDDQSGSLFTHKRLTTPADPSIAVIEGVREILRDNGCDIRAVTHVVHGTTLVTNAVIERKGANVCMLVTAGFRDTLEMGRERRYDLYDLRLQFTPPLVPRQRCVELRERMSYDGTVLQPLDLDEVAKALKRLVEDEGAEAVAVCLLHSYANPAHEEAVGRLLAERYPGTYGSISSDGFPIIREYERWTTTAMNAYVQPMVDRYLQRLEEGLRAIGFGGRLLIMSSSGGTLTPQTARRFPVRLLESGPAAGVLMSSEVGRVQGLQRLLSFDMGGTTAKGAIVLDSAPLKKYEFEAARAQEYRKGSGLSVRIPVIDMIEIGAGGGSIAALDERGLIRVGPRSAGADPGPACYRRGGDQATLTDANLVLGYLDPAFFLGGRMAIDRGLSETALAMRIGQPLGLSALRTAWGIHETISEDVARAFRVHASEHGVDYRSCSMVAFGGSGPLHAIRVAQKLKIPQVILPPGAGVMSALGMLVSPLSFEVVRFGRLKLDEDVSEDFVRRFAGLEAEAAAVLVNAGVERAQIGLTRALDMRYVGQGHEVEVHLPADWDPGSSPARLRALFAQAYARVFSISFEDKPIEIVHWKVQATGPSPMGERLARVVDFKPSARYLKGERAAYVPEAGRVCDCPVYDRYGMPAGTAVTGPALIEERESTVVVGAGVEVRVDPMLNIVAQL
ncbi:MAG: hydantoinase/oxoprolinase family protein [Lautropia sp.]